MVVLTHGKNQVTSTVGTELPLSSVCITAIDFKSVAYCTWLPFHINQYVWTSLHTQHYLVIYEDVLLPLGPAFTMH